MIVAAYIHVRNSTFVAFFNDIHQGIHEIGIIICSVHDSGRKQFELIKIGFRNAVWMQVGWLWTRRRGGAAGGATFRVFFD
mmetsp:Transcript_118480/g.342593  ORF Transcript_118480/g.342593 Transcript_118480/m.342593 type:complete len:81 (+) Transcript_118480:1742-1984(+)